MDNLEPIYEPSTPKKFQIHYTDDQDVGTNPYPSSSVLTEPLFLLDTPPNAKTMIQSLRGDYTQKTIHNYLNKLVGSSPKFYSFKRAKLIESKERDDASTSYTKPIIIFQKN